MNRYRRELHVRHLNGFSDEMFERFRSGCRLFQLHVRTVLAEWEHLNPTGDEATRGEYVFFPPELSPDRGVATLPIEGAWTLGSRAAFENASAHLLRYFFPAEFARDLEEGLTESSTGETRTNWRSPTTLLERALAAAAPFGGEPRA